MPVSNLNILIVIFYLIISFYVYYQASSSKSSSEYTAVRQQMEYLIKQLYKNGKT